PDGVLPPRLSSAAPASLQVVWSTPALNHAPGFPTDQFQMRPGHPMRGFLELFSNPSASLRALQLYTEYELWLVAASGFSSARSPWVLSMTTEDRPGPTETPILLGMNSRMMLMTWQHPLQRNGVTTHYNICQHDHFHLTSGNVTICTVAQLCPHTAYEFQVKASNAKGCSLSPESQTVWTLPAVPEGIPAPEMSSGAPTRVILSWKLPTQPNDLVDNFATERRGQRKTGVTRLMTLPRSHPMRFIDKTSALSLRTRFKHRILVSPLNGGADSSAWADVTTRPSRPAGVQPPSVQVQGPEAAKVTWNPQLIQNGAVLSYEICMPDPHVTISSVNATASVFSHVLVHSKPFMNDSVSVVSCSVGNRYLGGCTEHLSAQITTQPALLQHVNPLLVILISESYVGISCQPPLRPKGPNLRYELLRCKIQQPLASNPPEDLNLWHNIYSGTRWFYEDKGLSRFTTYECKVFVHSSVGFTPSPEVSVTVLVRLPERGANHLRASVLNHRVMDESWARPQKPQHGFRDASSFFTATPFEYQNVYAFQDLQGDVEYYTLFWNSATSNESLRILPDVNSNVIGHLNPNTEYRIFISVFSGVHSINSDVLRATTCDGEPQGMLPPEVVIIHSTAVRVIWTSPSNSNGVVTEYSVYVNNKLYKTGMNAPGPFILRDLSPFTICDIQGEVCTIHACVRSNEIQISNAEDVPSSMPTPTIGGITSRCLLIDWMSPGKPDGIILGYDRLQKTWHSCPKTQKLMRDHGGELCQVMACQKPETVCGHRCYSLETKVAGNGSLQYSGLDVGDLLLQVSGLKGGVQVLAGLQFLLKLQLQLLDLHTQLFVVMEFALTPNLDTTVVKTSVSHLFLIQLEFVVVAEYERHNQIITVALAIMLGTYQVKYAVQMNNIIAFPLVSTTPAVAECRTPPQETRFAVLRGSMMAITSSAVVDRFVTFQDEETLLKHTEAFLGARESDQLHGSRLRLHTSGDHGGLEEGYLEKEKKKISFIPLTFLQLSLKRDALQVSFSSLCCSLLSSLMTVTSVTFQNIHMACFLNPVTPYLLHEGLDLKISFLRLASHCLALSTCHETSLARMFCCGQDYVNMSDTICCSASSGESKAHVKKNDPMPVKCCETELIPESQRCCNGVGYNPLKYVCSDKISTGMMMKETRACETVCPASTQATAHCGRCNFIFTSHVCAVRREPRNSTGKASIKETYSSAKETVCAGSADMLSFTDMNLEPYTTYEYSVSACNSYGQGFHKAIRTTTKEDVPQQVSPSKRTKVINCEDAIFLNRRKLIQSNASVIYYILVQNGTEFYRGMSLSFSDTKGIQPFQEYSYHLKTCSIVRCVANSKVVAATSQGAPRSLQAPGCTAPRTEALPLSSLPEKPGGISPQYQLRQAGRGLTHTDTARGRQHTVTGLQPFTNYSFTLTACTSAGCASSEPFLGQTLQAAPQGVWMTPQRTIIDSATVELYWRLPEKPIGLFAQHQLSSNGTSVFLDGHETRNFTNKNLKPNSRCMYKSAATTGGARAGYIVEAPMHTPEEIQPPYNITVIGPYSIYVAWNSPGILIPKVPVEYNVLLSAGSPAPLTSSAGHHQSILLENLAPFTQYEIRIQACQNGGCGVSDRMFVKTSEAVPMDLDAPVLKALGSACIEVKWMPPKKPNGIITNYFIHRRPAGMEEASLLFVWSEGVLEFTDSTDTLRPFMLYEYQVRAYNSMGSVESSWSSAWTLEAPPTDLPAPWAQATSAHSVLLNWTEPRCPNGIISQYHVIYQERPDDPTVNVSTVRAFTV
ncbi:Usherin, partial [Galemys pyrenaicus]